MELKCSLVHSGFLANTHQAGKDARIVGGKALGSQDKSADAPRRTDLILAQQGA